MLIFPIRSFSYWKGPSKEVLNRTGRNSFSLQGSFTSFFRTFPFDYVKVAANHVFGRNEKTADVQLPQISHDLGIVVPRACAKIKKNCRCRFRARGDDAFAWLARAGGGAQGNQVWTWYGITELQFRRVIFRTSEFYWCQVYQLLVSNNQKRSSSAPRSKAIIEFF